MRFAKYAIAAAAVVVVAIVGLNVAGDSGVGGAQGGAPALSPTAPSSPAATRSPAASAIPSMTTPSEGALQPGTHAFHPWPAPNDGLTVTFTVPAGWEAMAGSILVPGEPRGTAVGRAAWPSSSSTS